MTKAYPNSTYFIRDNVSENGDITSVGIGDVWLYFYKQTLIGVHNHDRNETYVLDVNTIKEADGNMHPSVDEITEDAITKMAKDWAHSEEDGPLPKLHINDLGAKVKKLVAAITAI